MNNAENQSKKLTFVNLSHPAESSAQVRRLIRSTATIHSHHDPERKPKGKRRNAPEHLSIPASDRRGGSSGGGGGGGGGGEEASRSPPTPLDEPVSLLQPHERERLEAILRSWRDGGNVRASVTGTAHGDPFETYPVPTQAWFHPCLEHYRTIHLPPRVALRQNSPEEGREYIGWQLREAVSEPALFYMQLLSACMPLVSAGRLAEETLIWTRAQLVGTLNEAIGDPRRALTTAVVLTVAYIAYHEHLHGDKATAARIHKRAFPRLLALRGGIDSLPIPRIAFMMLHHADAVLSSDDPQAVLRRLAAASTATTATTNMTTRTTTTVPGGR